MTEYAPNFEANSIPFGNLLAGAAVTEFRCVTIGSSSSVVQTVAGGRVDGVAKIAAESGKPVTFARDGIVTVKAGGTFSDGDPLISTTDGKVIAATDGFGYLVALEGATVDAEVRAYLKERVNAPTGIEVITNTPGAISLATYFTLIIPTGTDAMTLAAGYDGQRKVIRQGTGASTPSAVITGAFYTDGTATTTATMNAAGDQLDLVYSTTLAAWVVTANVSTTMS